MAISGGCELTARLGIVPNVTKQNVAFGLSARCIDSRDMTVLVESADDRIAVILCVL